MANKNKMPVAFFGHGSPTNALEENEATHAWAQMAKRIGTPKAILCISAHWCTRGTKVTAMPKPKTIHDFGRGLPQALFTKQYPAPGSTALAKRVKELLAPTQVDLDYDWGLDHGTWSVLLKAYPKADIPVVQLSMDVTKPESWHHTLAQQLKPLRDEGILIAASGNFVHNLGVLKWDDTAAPYPWATRFNNYVKDCIEADKPEALCNFRDFGNDAAMSVPSEDHYWPLFYALGAREKSDKVTFSADYITFASLGMTSFLLETPDSK